MFPLPSPLGAAHLHFHFFRLSSPHLEDELHLRALMSVWNITLEKTALERLNNENYSHKKLFTFIDAQCLSLNLKIYPDLKSDLSKAKIEWDKKAEIATKTALQNVDNTVSNWKSKENKDCISTNGHGN